MGGLEGIVVSLVLGQAVGAIKDYGASVNWPQVKTQANTALQHVIPWHYAEVRAEVAVDGLIDGVADVLADETDVKTLLTDLAEKDWAGEVATLKALLVKEWKPENAEAQALLNVLKAA